MPSKSHGGAPPPEAVTGQAGDQPGAIPILDGAPSAGELPVDQGTDEPTALIYLDLNDDTVKVAAPDGSNGVSTGDLLDLSASIDLGTGDLTGLL